jgi:ribose transport system permease protein
VLAGLAVGLVVGTINGSLVTFLGIPSFLVTLAMLGITFGLAQYITNSAPQPILNDTFNAIFGGGNIGPIPGLLVWTVVAVVIGVVVLNKTRFGRQVLATGGNRVAAEYTGVNTKRITLTVMLVMSVVAAIAGMLYAGRLESGRYQWGTGDELSVIAAVILGGTSLFGGKGSVIGALVGSLLIGLINNGLILGGPRCQSAADHPRRNHHRRGPRWRGRSDGGPAARRDHRSRVHRRHTRPRRTRRRWGGGTGRSVHAGAVRRGRRPTGRARPGRHR